MAAPLFYCVDSWRHDYNSPYETHAAASLHRMNSPPSLCHALVYVRQHCHLCEDMIADLRDWTGEFPFSLEICDVDATTETQRLYGEKVPVLLVDNEEICHYYLDPSALSVALARGVRRIF
tara:strand:+ start:214 stop:576 length:363 start_codon:yes stop_codon:yes gene_type:complete